MAHMQNVEIYVREFLASRGFLQSMKSFEHECKNDKNKSYRVDKIVDSIMLAVQQSELQELRDIWRNLTHFFFTKLEQSLQEAVKKLESSVFKIYLVVAQNNSRGDKIADFFTKMASEIHSQADWRDWFYFQYCKNPEDHPSFAVYFTKNYHDTLFLSLHNFLATIFQSMPLPTLMRVDSETAQIKKLQEENAKLRQRLLQSQQAAGSAHQSRQQSFLDKKTRVGSATSEIVPFDIQPPIHLVDDFFIIAQESLSISDSQSRGFKSIIRNIGSSSPGRKDDFSKGGRSGSTNRS